MQRVTRAITYILEFGLSEPFTTIEQVDAYLNQPTIKCLYCGKRYKSLPGHVRFAHGMNAREYREAFGIPYSRSLSGTETRETRRVASLANYNANPKLYKQNFSMGHIAAKDADRFPTNTEAVKAQRAALMRAVTAKAAIPKYMTEDLFDEFIQALKDGQTKAEFCQLDGKPPQRKFTRYMQENPVQYERYKDTCRAQSFNWQYRNGTINKYDNGEGRFVKAVRRLYNGGKIDREIADKLDVSYEVVRRITKVWRKSKP